MTLQDRAAQWLLTVEETWKGTTGPLTYDPDARYIKGPDGLDVTGEHRDDDEQAGRDYRAFAAAPTHLSEGQALVRELLAEVDKEREARIKAETSWSESEKWAGIYRDQLGYLADDLDVYDDIDAGHDPYETVREAMQKEIEAHAQLYLDHKSLKDQLSAARKVVEAVKALNLTMRDSGAERQAEDVLDKALEDYDAAQTASEGE